MTQRIDLEENEEEEAVDGLLYQVSWNTKEPVIHRVLYHVTRNRILYSISVSYI